MARVRGHVRRNGSWVRGHTRRNPVYGGIPQEGLLLIGIIALVVVAALVL